MSTTLPKSAALAAAVSLAAASPLALADVRVVVGHFAPFADSVDATSVSIRLNGQVALQNVKYGDFTQYITLPAGPYLIEVVPTGTSTVAISANVTLADRDYTVLATGNGTLQPLALQALQDDNTPAAAGNLKLRVVHVAPFAASAASTAVSVRTDGGAVVGGLTSVPFAAVSPYLEIPAGDYDLKVATPDGRANLIDLAPVTLPSGAILTVLARGDGVNQPLGFTAIPLGALPSERPVDASVSGIWSTPGRRTSGFSFNPKPGENRLLGTWHTWTAQGTQQYFGLDSAGSRSGAAAAANGGFDNERAVFTVLSYSGGTFGGNESVQATARGTLTVDFADCHNAAASYSIDGIGSGSFDLTNLTPSGVCSLPEATR
jgi:hypothetical protein